MAPAAGTPAVVVVSVIVMPAAVIAEKADGLASVAATSYTFFQLALAGAEKVAVNRFSSLFTWSHPVLTKVLLTAPVPVT